MTALTWIGIALCVTQSALLSGLNLACFTVSKLELELETAKGNAYARRVLGLRKDANFLLVTILWSNVGVNVLLALLAGSVLAGVSAFLFSTVVITLVGEVVPQAYFSRHALRMGALLAPALRFYQAALFVVAKPTALVLDWTLGPEAIAYLEERDIRELIKLHMESARTEIQRVEGQGTLNFLAIDDLPLAQEGEPIDPQSMIQLEFREGRPVFPEIRPDRSDEFLEQVHRSGKKWVILVDESGTPRMLLDSDEFIRDALFGAGRFSPLRHCHRPILVEEDGLTIGKVLPRFKVEREHREDDVIDEDVILLWAADRRVITGADLLGRLLRGIAVRSPAPGAGGA